MILDGARFRQRRPQNGRRRPTRADSERAGINAGRTLKTKRHQHAWLERFPINAGFTDPGQNKRGGVPAAAVPQAPEWISLGTFWAKYMHVEQGSGENPRHYPRGQMRPFLDFTILRFLPARPAAVGGNERRPKSLNCCVE